MAARQRKQVSAPPPAAAVAHRERTAASAPAIRFRIDFNDRCSVGVGKIRLLEAIERTGSLSQAARENAMSYRRAWLLVDSMNAGFDTAVISATVGGSGGGGAKLTSFGRELIDAYRGLETRLSALAAQHMGEIAPHALHRASRFLASETAPRRSISKPRKRAG